MHPDQKYITALANKDELLIKEIYSRFSEKIKNTLIIKGCEIEEAGDIFQESLMDIYRYAVSGTFMLTCPLEAFLLLMCKRKFYNLNKKAGVQVTNEDDSLYKNVAGDANAGIGILEQEKSRQDLMLLLLEEMGNCKEVILKSFEDKAQEEIAASLQMSYAYYRKRKSNCLGELTLKIQKHPSYNELRS